MHCLVKAKNKKRAYEWLLLVLETQSLKCIHKINILRFESFHGKTFMRVSRVRNNGRISDMSDKFSTKSDRKTISFA